jgi:uncharacterized protein
MKQNWILSLVVLLLIASAPLLVGAAPEAPLAAISLASPYSQNFDTLATGGTSNTWTDDSTLSGWYSNRTAYIADAGTSTTGGLHSYGIGSATERAMGSLGSSGAPIVYYGAQFTNDTGNEVVSIQVGYTGEQWRNGGNMVQHKLVFEYQIGATNLTSGIWTPVTSLDFTGPIATDTTTSLDGNAAANRVVIGLVTINLSLGVGQDIWLRWTDVNDTGNDHGLAVDDLKVTAQNTTAITLRTLAAAPQGVAAALPLAGLALLGGLATFIRRRKA